MHVARAPNFGDAPLQTSAMLRLAATIAQCSGPEELLREIVPLLQRVVGFEVASFCLPGPTPDSLRPIVWDRGALSADRPELQVRGSASGWVWENQQPLLIRELDSETRFPALAMLAQRHVASLCVVPLSTCGRRVATLALASSTVGAYGPAVVELLQWLCGILALSIENTVARSALAKERKQVEVLLAIQKLLATHTDLIRALPDISQTLQGLLAHDVAFLSELHAGNDLVSTYQFDPAEKKLEQKLNLSVEQSLAAVVLQERNIRVLLYQDLLNLSEYPGVKLSLACGARSACLVPLMTLSGHAGMLAMCSRGEHAYRLADVQFLEHLSGPLAAALEKSRLNVSLRLREERSGVLAEINTALLSHESPAKAFPRVSELIQKVLPHEYGTFELHDKENDSLVRRVLDFPGGKGSLKDPTVLLSRTVGGRVLLAGRAMILDEADLKAFDDDVLTEAREHGIRSLCAAPLLRQGKAYGVVVLGSSQACGFSHDDLPFLEEVTARIALALHHSRVGWELRQLRWRREEGADDESRLLSPPVFGDVVGSSKQLLSSLNQVAIVATSDATVLVLGETGTGKDLIAKAIHTSSDRKERLLVKLNCAAIPTGLLESELFGHEKGSFTGATSQKIGRMELAHRGTLFLDEIGEIPMELQPKLLRVLQDQEFERLGGNRTIKVDFRLIAATNRDLQKAVLDGQFRADLYYRLNVFPITMPALRDRRSDIPDLVWHFVRKYEKRFSRDIDVVSPEAMRALVAWSWPGNVRELENFIERSVILTEGGELRVPVDELHSTVTGNGHALGSLEQTEREHILHVLRETGGALSGPRGAAERLGLKRTTLQSKMQRLGITRSLYWRQR
jgi:formate hydrogenlyase transcriptional activator